MRTYQRKDLYRRNNRNRPDLNTGSSPVPPAITQSEDSMNLRRYWTPLHVGTPLVAVSLCGIVVVTPHSGSVAGRCAPGYRPVAEMAREVRAEMSRESASKERGADMAEEV